MSLWQALLDLCGFGNPALNAKADAGKATTESSEDRSNWTKQQYSSAIAARLRGCPDAAGLGRHRDYLRMLGQEIYEKLGLMWAQELWNAQMKEFGPLAVELSQIWVGIGAWKTPTDADALAAELIYIGRHAEYTVTKDDGSGRYDQDRKHKRAKEIGELLNQDAGIEMMRYAHAQVRAAGCDATDLELCWNGIGEWRR